MKKTYFTLAAIAVFAFAACNGKSGEGKTDSPAAKVDSPAVNSNPHAGNDTPSHTVDTPAKAATPAPAAAH